MGRRTRSTVQLSEQLLLPEIADLLVSSDINHCKIASKAYAGSTDAIPTGISCLCKTSTISTGEPLWADHQQYSSPERQETPERANLCLPAVFSPLYFFAFLIFFLRWGDVKLSHVTVFALLAFDCYVAQHSRMNTCFYVCNKLCVVLLAA